MFRNIGGKIKTVAAVITWIGIIVSVIVGGVCMSDGMMGIGFLIMLIGSLISWLSSFMLYGFGQLIDNTDKLVKNQISGFSTMKENNSIVEEKEKVLKKWKEEGLINEEEYNAKTNS